MNNIFKNIKFGDRFLTRDGRMAIYKRNSPNCVQSGNILCFTTEDKDYEVAKSSGISISLGTTSNDDIVSHYQEPIDAEKLIELAYEHIKFDYGVVWDENEECSFEDMCDIDYEDEMYSFRKGYRKAKENY